jgi:glycine/D-amino acid oxidase-like deaminating enzyme
MGYKTKSRSLGAEYITDAVAEITTEKNKVSGVKLVSGGYLYAPVVVNCAGAWAGKIAETAGIDIRVAPVKRQVFALDPAVRPTGPLPLTVLSSGLYFRTETNGKIHGGRPRGIRFFMGRQTIFRTVVAGIGGICPEF